MKKVFLYLVRAALQIQSRKKLLVTEFKGLEASVGQFPFWIKTEANRYDVDGAVNANVLFYLGLSDNTAPIVDYMLDVIARKKKMTVIYGTGTRLPFTIFLQEL